MSSPLAFGKRDPQKVFQFHRTLRFQKEKTKPASLSIIKETQTKPL